MGMRWIRMHCRNSGKSHENGKKSGTNSTSGRSQRNYGRRNMRRLWISVCYGGLNHIPFSGGWCVSMFSAGRTSDRRAGGVRWPRRGAAWCFPSAASPRFSPPPGQGDAKRPGGKWGTRLRARGVPPAAAGGERPAHTVGRKETRQSLRQRFALPPPFTQGRLLCGVRMRSCHADHIPKCPASTGCPPRQGR